MALGVTAFSRGESMHSSHGSHGSHSKSPSSGRYEAPDIDYMEPAVDGPPSPERLRQLSKQMKRASHLNRPRIERKESHDSSTSTSLSQNMWDQSTDSTSLSRRSSSRSSPNNDRSERESVQMLGRNLFQRKKANRASSSQSSSNSSMYSFETPPELPAKDKDSLLPSLFTRRKASRDDSSQPRVQISGPFNFQHVAHTRRDSMTDPQRDSIYDMGPMQPDARAPHGLAPQNLHHPSHSVDSIDSDFNSMSLGGPASHMSMVQGHAVSAFGPHGTVRPSKSQDFLRSSPPCSMSNNSPPVPPPRMSSRHSAVPDSLDVFPSLDRPRTSGGFRQPQPFDPWETDFPPATSQELLPPVDMDAFSNDERRFSHAVTTTDDTAWPLSCSTISPSRFEAPLPDVPEEEEHAVTGRRSRMSITSTRSSLRGSQSVPALRSYLHSPRPASEASDTLGPSETDARDALFGDESPSTETGFSQDNWEDDIDYCYEHEADANFDYQWERPSLDGKREEVRERFNGGQLSIITSPDSSFAMSPNMESDVSPTQCYPPSINSYLGPSSNFSLPRGERAAAGPPESIRPISYASSFRESQGFNLSPSLLIPGDFHQQMLADRVEGQDGPVEMAGSPLRDEMSIAEGRSPMSYQRSSTSTMGTNSTSHTDFTGERHASANSALTAMTRLTVSSSSTSLNKIVLESVATGSLSDAGDAESEDDSVSSPQDTVPELTAFPVPSFAKKGFHRSHASESIVRAEAIAQAGAQDPARLRRPRARTSSLSAQVAPPVGQYTLFPKSPIKGMGGHI
ncbi:hypothetical protein GMORB2_3098 [Geosmithia morbida]|uniref:CRIB domain-containing protein n=1 Tax=Geosmithia morbida TaxID=1094350 RepID=A0A9P4YPQ2_9HYPO|nr:uncharacterized protein GMORB2_3098 [Geosmithia morbida]KAF4120297.1 hypothetical protein GMORB2_3098 [Geosmithia morbida]